MSWAAIGAAVAGAAVSAGASYAIGQASKPAQPDLASSSRELAKVNADMLPMRRALEAAAKQGKSVTIPNYPAHNETRGMIWVDQGSKWAPGEQSLSSNIQDALKPDPTGTGIITALGLTKKQRKLVAIPETEWQEGGKFFGQPKPGPVVQQTYYVPEGPKTIDFTGYGEADANAVVARETAKAQLALQQKYGVQFAESAAEQQKLADPEGYAARQKMNEIIQGQINRTPDRTIANTLDQQIGKQLQAGRGLDAETQALLDDAVFRAGNDRGGIKTPAVFSDPLTQGWAGQQRLDAGVAKAQNWLSSGMTPQDAAFREEQQNLSNLSSLVNGRTPESQFSNLSAPGPTPFTPGGSNPQLPNNAAAGSANAINAYNASINQQQSQMNDWMAGLSGLLSVGNAALKKTG